MAGLTTALAHWVRKELPQFPFSSIHVNLDSQHGLHVDDANDGLAAIVALGPFEGGRLLVIPPTSEPRL